MELHLSEQLKSHKTLLVSLAFYFFCALLAAIIFCCIIFTYEISTVNEKTNVVDQKLLVYASSEQKASEQEVFSYKKKVDEFNQIIDNHRNSLNVFTFIEEKTVADVWFMSFNISEIKREINLLGEAQTMSALSNQVKIFEEDKEHVKSINVLNSQITPQGRVRFTLSLSLNPTIFK